MIPAAQVHEWAERVAPINLSLAIIAFVVGLAVFFGYHRVRRDLPTALPGLVFLSAGAAALYLDLPSIGSVWGVWLLSAVAAIAWVAHLRMRGRSGGAEPVAGKGAAGIDDRYFAPFEMTLRSGKLESADLQISSRLRRALLTVCLLATAVLLFDDLGGYAGTLVSWESPVMSTGFGDAFRRDVGLWDFTRQTFYWDNGVLSRGDTSLFFGPPTYALFHWIGFSAWAMRFGSAVALLLTMLVVYRLGRRFFSPLVGVASTFFFGFATVAIFYGRFGSSIAGTLLAVSVMLYCVWLFLDRPQSRWWTGALCALALFLVTLQYAPARLLLLFLLGFVPLALALQPSRFRWQTVVGVLVIAAAVAVTLRFEQHHGSLDQFLRGRGEQYFELLNNPGSIEPLVGIDVGDYDPDTITWSKRLEVLRKLVGVTVPQFFNLVTPMVAPRPGGLVVRYDPPAMPMYYAPVSLFIVLGMGYSLQRRRSWLHLCLLLIPIAYGAPLLLTNRVDTHRAVLLLFPFAFWAALGCREVADLLYRMRVPLSFQIFAASAFAASMAYADIYLRYPPSTPVALTSRDMVELFGAIRGNVFLGLVYDHRERGWVDMHLLERRRLDARDESVMLAEGIVNGLRSDRGGPRRLVIRQAESLARRGTLLLGPQRMFRAAAADLQRQGLRVGEEHLASFDLFRVDAGAQRTGVPDDEFEPLPEISATPAGRPVRLSGGPRKFLTTAEALDVKFGFQPPRSNQTWRRTRVRMGGVEYRHALGTHAWTRMTFTVPPEAVAFQAVVGLSDEIRDCESAGVVFEVRDPSSRLLFSSGSVDSTTAPQPIQIPVRDLERITLVVTEGGDGRDCDHANWGDAAFVFEPRGGPVATPTSPPNAARPALVP